MAKVLLYGPDNKPMRQSGGFFRRDAAKRTGSLSNWNPRQVFGHAAESMERDAIIGRAINLTNDDPNAEGIIGTFATSIIGAGLKPSPELDHEALGISKESARKIEAKQKFVYKTWSPYADVGQRMTDGEIQHLKCRCLFGIGDSFEIMYMRKDGPGLFSMASQIINPLRVRTPTDMVSRGDVIQGVKVGKYGEPISYFVKKPGASLADISKNFTEVPAKRGHRWSMLHDFISKDPEQVRGYPILSPAIRFFRDLGDLLGAELTSNVVTAAMSVFIADESDPSRVAQSLLAPTTGVGARPEETRYQNVDPGEIWYGSAGQKPHLLSADRPGTTFDPFTKLIKKSIGMATGIPFPVLFKDVDGVSFAGFRAAMLEAWRVYSYHRTRIGQGDCQKKYTMLMEEAWLRDLLPIGNDFNEKREAYTEAAWYGAPKGDIEPFKAIQADILKNTNGIKTKDKIIIEDGGAGFTEIAAQILEEREIEAAYRLNETDDEEETENDQ
ncbi:MAG: phage portal protein [Planctomycetes bacterium]|nr:phage portal protein [Planctomycetota bacterium]